MIIRNKSNKSIYLRMNLFILIFFFLVKVLIGCAAINDSSSQRHQISLPKNALNHPPEPTTSPDSQEGTGSIRNPLVPLIVQQGTSTTAGGDGLGGKIFESYRRKITTLKVFNNCVLPSFSGANTSEAFNDHNKELFKNEIEKKIWYFAPVDLEEFSHTTLGISWISNPIQPLARQSLISVWVDSRRFDKMSEQEQCDTLVHEIVMSIFIKLHFVTSFIPQNSNLNSSNPQQIDLSKDPSYNEFLFEASQYLPNEVKEKYKKEKFRTLNSDEYENIRFVSGWILDSRSNSRKNGELGQLLNERGFLPPYMLASSASNNQSSSTEQEIQPQQWQQIFRQSQGTNRIPKDCFFPELKVYSQCDFKFILFKKAALLILNIQLINNGKEIITENYLLNSQKLLKGDCSFGICEKIKLTAITIDKQELKLKSPQWNLNLYLKRESGNSLIISSLGFVNVYLVQESGSSAPSSALLVKPEAYSYSGVILADKSKEIDLFHSEFLEWFALKFNKKQ